VAEVDVTPSLAARRTAASSRPTGLRRHAEILLSLSEADLRARYGRGRFRLAKWLLDPFALLGVYLILVTFVLKRPGEAPGLSLACAIVPFQLVMSTVVNSTGGIAARESIILNMRFERTLLPAATVTTETAAFLGSLSMIVMTMIAYGIPPTEAILWYPLVFVVNVALAVAAAYPSSLIGVWLPDLRPFVISFARAMFFLAPGLVPLAAASGTAESILRLNPLTGLFQSYRAIFLFGEAPDPVDIAYPLGLAVLALGLVGPLYHREQKQFAKVVE
jgi:ABC-type polysaccharide/polyol phosphate export permease